MRRVQMPKILKIVLGLLLFCGAAIAADVTLAWDASESEGVTGYKIHVGTQSGTYDRTEDVGLVLTYTVMDLAYGKRFFFAATAYDATQESAYSNEVSKALVSCDLNADQSTNILDMQIMANLIQAGAAELQYDLNMDGALNILDMQLLANIILGQASCPQ